MNSMNAWFRNAVVYELYIRSFYDADGNGVGDIRGIIEKLDYLCGTSDSLGVDAIWITPFYPSPMKDFGYDITNYTDVDPIFGKLEDFKELITKAHARDLKIVIDFVPNHTSDQHPWFQAAKRSRDDPKRHWYVWHDGDPATPPNNWQSLFGGSAWTWDEATQQYYLHSFLPEQPDLNWDNPELRAAMQDQLRFWCELGVDGFRIDAAPWLSKDPLFRDVPLRPGAAANDADKFRAAYNQYGRRVYKNLQSMADVLEQYDERFMLAEAYPEVWNDVKAYRKLYHYVNPRVSAPFNFELLSSPWEPGSLKRYIDEFQQVLDPEDVPVYCLGNHDKSRLASHVGAESVRLAAMLLLSLPGTVVMYYGEELGLPNGTVSIPEVPRPGSEDRFHRDHIRWPMPWDQGPQRGFSRGETWLPVYQDEGLSVASQLGRDDSTLNFYRGFLTLRKHQTALMAGRYEPLETPPGTYGFMRVHEQQKLAIVLNFSGETVPLSLGGTTLFSTHGPGSQSAQLWPHEGQVIALSP